MARGLSFNVLKGSGSLSKRPEMSDHAMSNIVFSVDLSGTWGSELASTLGHSGTKALLLSLFETMANSENSEPLSDGLLLHHRGTEFLVLQLTDIEADRLSAKRAEAVGGRIETDLVCERIVDLIDAGILDAEEIGTRVTRRISL